MSGWRRVAMMPSDDAYQAVLKALSEMVDTWRVHREVINRAVNQLNHEVIALTDRFGKDDEARGKRQIQIDTALKNIQDGQDRIRRWQYARIGIELLAIIAVVAYLFGRNL